MDNVNRFICDSGYFYKGQYWCMLSRKCRTHSKCLNKSLDKKTIKKRRIVQKKYEVKNYKNDKVTKKLCIRVEKVIFTLLND